MVTPSSRACVGKKTYLTSSWYLFKTPSCITFVYRMHGALQGVLSMFTSNMSMRRVTLARVMGSLSDVWVDARVDVPVGYQQVVFEAQAGHSGKGSDVELKEVILDPNRCDHSCKCSLEISCHGGFLFSYILL